MRVAILQTGASADESLAAMDAAAARCNADLLIMPELFMTGYAIGADALRARAQPADGAYFRAAADVARRHRLGLLYGYPERGEDERLYNSAALLGANGAPLANYRKLHLFGDMERAVFTPGEASFAVADIEGVRISVMICYDVEFPEMVRNAALRGADLVAVPTALMQPYDFVARVLVRARAYENQVFLAYANRTGHEGALDYVGESCIVGPDGEALARAGAGGDELIVAELDMAALARSRALYTYLQDRRPAHYAAPETAPMSVLHPATRETETARRDITTFGPDFPFAFDDWLRHPAGLGRLPAEALGAEVAIVGGGIAGVTAAYELMKLGLKPVLYEAGRLGGRLRSEKFEGDSGLIAELGGMRFPKSSVCFYHYLDLVGLQTRPFPNPLDNATPSTLLDLEGDQVYVEGDRDLPAVLREISDAWRDALEENADFSAVQAAIRARDTVALKALWNRLVPLWDERTFYDFVASSRAFQKYPFRHREIFGQVGFGTGGWDSDFPNSMLEILRVAYTNLDEDQRLVVGGVESLPRRLWAHAPENCVHWPAGTSLSTLHQGSPRPGVTAIARADGDRFLITDRWGGTRIVPAVLVTCQSWLLTTHIDCDESLLSQPLWMALDRTRYMQSSKTFVMVDRPFWRDRDPATGRYTMSMTLTDRVTRGTYLFDEGEGKPASICLSYSWMGDALKMLPLPVDQRVSLMLRALGKIYPGVDIASHIIGSPITVSWESDPNFLGAFKGALPGHYRYNHRMYCHFMQADKPPAERGIFLAGDGISWTPAWAEGAIQTALNAVWGIVAHLGGASIKENTGPGEAFPELGPIAL